MSVASRSRPRAADPDNPGRSVSQPPLERGKVDGQAAYQQVPGHPTRIHRNFDPATDPIPPEPNEAFPGGYGGLIHRGIAAEATRPPLGAQTGGSPADLERDALRLWKLGNHRQALAELGQATHRAKGKEKTALRKLTERLGALIEWEQGMENRERKAGLLAQKRAIDAQLAVLE